MHAPAPVVIPTIVQRFYGRGGPAVTPSPRAQQVRTAGARKLAAAASYQATPSPAWKCALPGRSFLNTQPRSHADPPLGTALTLRYAWNVEKRRSRLRGVNRLSYWGL